MIFLKSKEEISLMKEAGKLVYLTHQELKKYLKEGITTKELDELAYRFIVKNGAKPSFKGYNGFPASICVSLNEELVHGIPKKRKLKNGDIISIDIGVFYNGYHGDSAWTYAIGKISAKVLKFLKVAEKSLYAGIAKALVGNRLGDISFAIQEVIESEGFSVVRDYVGHGIGRNLHEEPPVPNFGIKGTGLRLKEGLTIAIEPMVCMGDFKVKTLNDGWTVVTEDKSLTCHFEHTVALTNDGPVILTID